MKLSSVEQKTISVNIINQGKYTAILKRINAPLSIQKFMKSLPLKGRALKQGSKLILASELKIRPENPKIDFSVGDISIDPSSGNISIHLENNSKSNTAENLLGTIQEYIETKGMVISSGILIKEIV